MAQLLTMCLKGRVEKIEDVRNKAPHCGAFLLGRVDMAELCGRKVVEVGGIELTVKELGVAEIRALLLSAETEDDMDALGDLLFPDIRLRDLMLFTSLTVEQVEGMLPSQLEEVIRECKAMNRHFFDLGARMARAGQTH